MSPVYLIMSFLSLADIYSLTFYFYESHMEEKAIFEFSCLGWHSPIKTVN